MGLCWPYPLTLPKILQALRILLTPWDWNEHTSWDCILPAKSTSINPLKKTFRKPFKRFSLDEVLPRWKVLDNESTPSCGKEVSYQPAYPGTLAPPAQAHISHFLIKYIKPPILSARQPLFTELLLTQGLEAYFHRSAMPFIIRHIEPKPALIGPWGHRHSILLPTISSIHS